MWVCGCVCVSVRHETGWHPIKDMTLNISMFVYITICEYYMCICVYTLYTIWVYVYTYTIYVHTICVYRLLYVSL